MGGLGRLGVALLLALLLAIPLLFLLPDDDPGSLDPGEADPLTEVPRVEEPAPEESGPEPELASDEPATEVDASAAATATTGDGMIQGHVEDADGQRVAGVRIRVEHLHWSTHEWPPNDEDPIRTATSDNSGAFEVRDLPMGGYGLVAEHDGLGSIQRVDVNDKNRTREVVLRLVPVGEVTGTVVNGAGQPVVGAVVRPVRHGPQSAGYYSWSPSPVRARSDAAGNFRLAPLVDDRWQLEVRARGYSPVHTDWVRLGDAIRVVLDPGARVAGRAIHGDTGAPASGLRMLLTGRPHMYTAKDRVVADTDGDGNFEFEDVADGNYTLGLEHEQLVLDGEAITADVIHGRGPMSLSVAVVTGGVITGRTFDLETGTVLAGVQVNVNRHPTNQALGRSGTSDTDGNYRIEGLPQGTFSLHRAPYEGYPNANWNERTLFSAEPGDELGGFDFALTRGLAVTGVVRDTEGSGVAGVQVHAYTEMGGNNQNMLSRDDGSFVLYGYEADDRVRMQARKSGMAALPLDVITVPPRGDATVEIQMVPEASISGIVRDPAGAPVEGVQVQAFQPGVWWGMNPVLTDDDGAFRVGSLAPGKYELMVTEPNNYRWNASGETRPSVELEEAEHRTGVELTFEGQEGLTISGRVHDADGEPIHWAQVQVHTQGMNASTSTDPDGNFTLGGLDEGEYTLQVSHQQYATQREVKARTGSTDVVIQLQPRATVAGTVLNQRDGKPVEEFEIAVLSGRHSQVQPWMSWQFARIHHEEGRFRIPGVEPGECTIAVRAAGFAEVLQPLSGVASGEVVEDVVVELEAGLQVAGQVVSSSGDPVAGAMLFIGELPQEWGRAEAAVARSDADGRFVVEGVARDAQKVTAYHADYVAGSSRIRGGQSTGEVRIELTRGGTVRGRVYFPDGVASTQSWVSVNGGEAAFNAHRQVDSDGGFVVEPVPSGTLNVSVGYNHGGSHRSQSRVAQMPVEGDVELEFRFAATNATLVGTILGPDDGPAQGWLTLTFQFEGGGSETYNQQIQSDGTYRFASVPAGEGHLQVQVQGAFRQQAATVETIAGQEVTHDITLSGGCRVIGRVTNMRDDGWQVAAALTGEHEIEKVSMEVFVKLQTQVAATIEVDDEGNFRLEGLEPGTYTLVVLAFDERPQGMPDFEKARLVTQKVELEEDDKLEVTLHLPGG